LEELEEAAESVLSTRREVIDLDRQEHIFNFSDGANMAFLQSLTDFS
jgi:hypothetical protein